MKIKQKTIRNIVILSCIVLVLLLAGCFIKPAVTPSLPEQPTFTHYRVVTQVYKDSNPAHSVEIAWRANSIDYSFKIFKSFNGGSFEELFDDGVDQSSYYQRKSCSCSFTDIEVQPGNQYSYYVLAYDEKEEIGQTEIFSREIFLPPCTLKEPQNNAEVDTPIPTFSWDNQELTKYLTKSKAEGYLKTHLKVNDETVQEEVWDMTFEDTTVDNVTYNLDNTGMPLENEHEYEWFHWTDAYDAEGNLIANAYSNSWHFHYKGPIKAVLMGKVMVPETSKSISKDITGLIPLVDATVTITDSQGITHTGTTQAQGQYILPQVAPGTNYIITAVGEVDGQTVVYKDVVPSIALHEVFDAGIADAESTALALVMEALLADDPNLTPEEINLDDILNAGNFTALVVSIDQTLNSNGNVTTDPEVADAVEIVEEELLFFANFESRSHIHRGLNGELGHYIHLLWKPHPDANSYQIYKKVGSSVFTIVNLDINYDEGMNRYEAWEEGVDPEVVYEYYIEAVTLTETVSCPPEIVDTWLPATTPEIPTMNAVITNSNPTFQWQSLGITAYPYQTRIYSGDVELHVTDETTGEDVWEIEINGLDISSVAYNDPRAEESAIPLVEGHEYSWFVIFDGNDGPDFSGKEIANSSCRSIFYYGYKPWIVYYNAETTSPEEAVLGIRWNDCTNANDYKIYKSIDNTNFGELTDDYTFRNGWYRFHDFDVTLGDTYYYKVEAYNNTSLINTSEVMIVNTWLPGITALSPINNEVVIAINPTFSWQYELTLDFPYGTFEFDGGGLIVEDVTSDETVWDIDLDDFNTSSITYAGSPLTEGHRYYWEHWISSRNEEGNSCTTNTDGSFYYGFPPLGGTSLVETNGDNPPQYYTRGGWIAYPGATSYDLYRKEGIGDFGIINIELHFDEEDNEYNFWDADVSSGITYQYYVVAKDASGPIYQSDILIIDTWLSPISVDFPEHDSVLTETNLPLQLQWTSPAPFPANIISGDINIGIYDETSGEDVWEYKTYDLNVTSVTIPNDEIEFHEGHKYFLHVVYDGEDIEDEIANTACESWFYYGNQPFEVEIFTWTGQDEDFIQYGVHLCWEAYPGADSYIIYKSIGGSGHIPIDDIIEEDDGEFEANDLDLNVVSPGLQTESYAYYVCAYDNSEQEIARSETKVRDTWLPAISCVSPPDYYETIESGLPYSPVNDPNQLFIWDSIDIGLPYGSVKSGFSSFKVNDRTEGVEESGWRVEFEDDFQTSQENYNYNGTAPALQLGHNYRWNVGAEGFDENGEKITECDDKGYCFYYQEIPWDCRTDAHSGVGYINVRIQWNELANASYYKVLRSIDNVNFGEPNGVYEWDGEVFYLNDETVSEVEAPYYYKIKAYDTYEALIKTSDIMIVDTWLPAMIADHPIDNEVVASNTITFTWHYDQDPFNFPSSYEFHDAGFSIHEASTGNFIFGDHWDDYQVTARTYENLSLEVGKQYEWGHYIYGQNDAGTGIASTTGGSLYYGEAGKVSGVEAIAFTSYINEENQSYRQIWVQWLSYPEAISYHIYKRTGGMGDFLEIFGDYQQNNERWNFIDEPVEEGNIYDYYVTAETAEGETLISEIRRVDSYSWYPPYPIVSPAPGSIVTDSTPVLEWSHLGVPDLPYNSICEGQIHIHVYDRNSNEEMWQFYLEDIQGTSVVYNQNNEGSPLQLSHAYDWNVIFDGFDSQGKQINVSMSWSYFYYGNQPWEVNIAAGTHTDLPNGHNVEVRWNNFTGANNYEVWKSENNGSFTKLLDNYEENEGWYWLNDWDVTDGNTYDYYVVALDGGTVIQTSPTITQDTWLPAILPVSPLQGSLVTEPNPVFECYYEAPISFPYNDEFEYNGGGFNLNDIDTGVCVWEIEADEDVFEVTYDGPALIEGHEYQWGRWLGGENGNVSIFSVCNGGGFYYGDVPWKVNYHALTASSKFSVDIMWEEYPSATNYKVLRSLDGNTFQELLGEISLTDNGGYNYDEPWLAKRTYYYKVEAYNDSSLIKTSKTLIVDTWLPNVNAIYPVGGVVLNEENPIFTWEYEILISFPYNGKYNFNRGAVTVRDPTSYEIFWSKDINNPDIFSCQYDGLPLLENQKYEWCIWISGEDEDGNCIISCSGGFFYYQNMEILSRFSANTYESSESIRVMWINSCEATDYKIYKSDNSDEYIDITGNYNSWWPGWLSQVDNDVILGNNYKYYIEAFKDGVKIGSSPIMTVDTWFPRMISLQPYEEEIISDLYPVFCWDYESPILFPYNGYNLKYAKFGVSDTSGGGSLMNIDLDYDPNIFSITYFGPEMIDGHRHSWYRSLEAEKDMGSYSAFITTRCAGDFTFDANVN